MEDPVVLYDALIRSGAKRLTGYRRRLFQAEVAIAVRRVRPPGGATLRLGAPDRGEGTA